MCKWMCMYICMLFVYLARWHSCSHDSRWLSLTCTLTQEAVLLILFFLLPSWQELFSAALFELLWPTQRLVQKTTSSSRMDLLNYRRALTRWNEQHIITLPVKCISPPCFSQTHWRMREITYAYVCAYFTTVTEATGATPTISLFFISMLVNKEIPPLKAVLALI